MASRSTHIALVQRTDDAFKAEPSGSPKQHEHLVRLQMRYRRLMMHNAQARMHLVFAKTIEGQMATLAWRLKELETSLQAMQ